ncbi:MAG: hypothetical protein R3B45_17835 [Bdellovibrionota bacterium]
MRSAYFLMMLTLMNCGQDPAFNENIVTKPAADSRMDLTKTIDVIFNTSVKEQDTLDINIDRYYREVVLQTRRNKQTQTLQQIDRILLNDSYRQGSKPGSYTEEFQQIKPIGRPLDILIVIDNSDSMRNEQSNLSEKLDPLLKYVKQQDWQIAITTTDKSDTCLRDLIKKGEDNIEERFSHAIEAGIDGSSNERGFLKIKMALLNKGCTSESWLRDDSMLAVLIVSDEDNCSYSGQDCDDNEDGDPAYVLNFVESIRTIKVDAKFYGIIRHPSLGRWKCRQAQNPAVQYAEVIEKSEGQWGAICDDDYSETLNAVSENVEMTMNNRFDLALRPIEGTLKVMVDGIDKTKFTTIIGKVLKFTREEIPKTGAKIAVSYQHGSEPIVKEFQLSAAASKDTIKVEVNELQVSKDKWSFDENTNVIKFLTFPEEKARIDISYREQKELASEFEIRKLPNDINSLKISINGEQTDAYDLQDEKLVFMNPPLDGAIIVIEYLGRKEPILQYPINNRIKAQVYFFDKESGKEIEALIDSGFFSIKKNEFIEGKVIAITSSLRKVDPYIIELPHEPIAESITVMNGVTTCSGTGKIRVRNNMLNISNCEFSIGEAVLITYDYEISHENAFVIEELSSIEQEDILTVEIKVGGKLVKNFHFIGNQLILNEPYPTNAEVVVSLQVKSRDFNSL